MADGLIQLTRSVQKQDTSCRLAEEAFPLSLEGDDSWEAGQTTKSLSLNEDKMNFSTLRNIQGLHAPLKLQMEFKAVKQVQRLPFLHSSNLSLEILNGNYDSIGFEDILNDPAQSEVMGDPHMMMEHKLGLL
uniref:Uncharacterized protein n=1 Tax=Sphaerodactylus townsendi TaxID=933632 RepID=A0ACB8FGQ3_9SAUR